MAVATKSVWQQADDNFCKQISMLKAVSGISNMMELSAKAGLKRQRLNKLVDQPRLMRISEMRLLIILFRRYGLEFDVMGVTGGARA